MVKADDGEFGDQNANDIVWLHGAGLSASTWRSDIGGIKPDLPGHGTAACISNPSVERYADTIEPALPDRFALVGHSLGGMIALELAARYPQRVRGLVLAEAVPTVLQSRISFILTRISKAVMTHIGPKRLAWLSGFSEPEPVRQHLRRQLGSMTEQGIRDALEAAIQYDGRPLMPDIKAPTLIIIGERNKATHAGAQLLHNGIVHARLTKMSGGHMIHAENPNQFYTAAFDFLRDKE